MREQNDEPVFEPVPEPPKVFHDEEMIIPGLLPEPEEQSQPRAAA